MKTKGRPYKIKDNIELLVLGFKTCSKCLSTKNIVEFQKVKHHKDGRASHCKNCESLRHKMLYKNGSFSILKRNKVWRENNREKARHLSNISKKTNRKYYNAVEANRRAAKLNATPKWANLDKIKDIYKNCPKGFHVDHIIPLKGKNITGLHVDYNLQYLPALDNIKKGNRI